MKESALCPGSMCPCVLRFSRCQKQCETNVWLSAECRFADTLTAQVRRVATFHQADRYREGHTPIRLRFHLPTFQPSFYLKKMMRNKYQGPPKGCLLMPLRGQGVSINHPDCGSWYTRTVHSSCWFAASPCLAIP